MITRRGKGAFLVIACMLVGALYFALPFLYEPALLFLSAYFLAAWIMHLNQKSLFLMFFISSRELARGNALTVEYMLSNKHFIPIFSAQVNIHLMKELGLDAIEEGHYTFNPYEIKAIKRSVICNKRGYYTVGSLTVRLRDPLGFFECTKWIERPVAVTVFPRVDCSTMRDENHRQGGNLRVNKKRFIEQPTEIDQLRRFMPGDALRTIHWRASAKRQEIISKSLLDRAQKGLWLILEGNRAMVQQFDEMELESVMDYVASLTYSAVKNEYQVKVTLVGTTILTYNCFDQESLRVFLEGATGFIYGGETTAEDVIKYDSIGNQKEMQKRVIGKKAGEARLPDVIYDLPMVREGGIIEFVCEGQQ